MNRYLNTPLLSVPTLALIFLAGCADKATEDPNANLSSGYIDPGVSSVYIDPGLSSAFIDPGISYPAYSSSFFDPGISFPAYSSSFTGYSFPTYSSSSFVWGQSSAIIPVSSSQIKSSSSSAPAPSSSSGNPLTTTCGGKMPSPITNGQSGYGTRYWDCCKPSCSWPDKTTKIGAPNGVSKNCSVNNTEIMCFDENNIGTKSGCEAGGEAYTCYSQAPYAVCDKLSYGYAAVPGNSPMCGRCFQLDFDGKGKYSTKAAHQAMLGKSMIVMASNTGNDVAGGQFDIMIPGGGVGAFAGGCKTQWGVDVNDKALVGETYGGLLTTCQNQLGYNATNDKYKSCVKTKCQNLFGNKPALADLLEGCNWFVDWFETADNPTFKYKEVTCPAELVQGYRSTFH